ncbi:MAG: fumarylacetoacetate hydrolase family protein [Marmoricola sp.]
MTTTIYRARDGWWVRAHSGLASPLPLPADASTGEVLQLRSTIAEIAAGEGTREVDSLDLQAPITAPCRVVAQMTNYASHVRDAGMNPASVPLTFFRKTSGSISGPTDDILKPDHVRFLDYEVEVALVIGRTLEVGASVTAENLHEYVAGLVVTNDVSARDLQLPKTQFFESKSYPTFTPTGPALVLVDDGDLARFDDLRLTLTVNGEVRQDMVVGTDIMYRPLEALSALSGFQRLDPGDIVLTGTPVGTALSAPPKPVELIGSLLPAATKWRLFFKRQAANPKYLKDGDVVEASARTDDGAIDLGTQRTVVRFR